MRTLVLVYSVVQTRDRLQRPSRFSRLYVFRIRITTQSLGALHTTALRCLALSSLPLGGEQRPSIGGRRNSPAELSLDYAEGSPCYMFTIHAASTAVPPLRAPTGGV